MTTFFSFMQIVTVAGFRVDDGGDLRADFDARLVAFYLQSDLLKCRRRRPLSGRW